MADFTAQVNETVGKLFLELAAAKAVIHELQAQIKQLQEGKAAKESPPHDGA